MKNKRYCIRTVVLLAVLLISAVTRPGFAEDTAILEIELEQLRQTLELQQVTTDSLQTELEILTHRIDQEKAKSGPDRTKLGNLMARALTISDQIDQQVRHTEKTSNRLKTLRDNLDRQYKVIIDSLRNLNESGEEAQLIETRILYFTEKRLLIAPRMASLSFDPEKISQIRLETVSDSLQKAICVEYLLRARTEIDDHRQRLNQTRIELEEIVKIRQKTDEFIAEVDDDEFRFYRPGSQAQTLEAFGDGDDSYTEDRVGFAGLKSGDIFLSQVQFFGLLSEQLGPVDPSAIEVDWVSPADSTTVNLTAQDYLELLRRIEEQLEAYHLLISVKLEPVE